MKIRRRSSKSAFTISKMYCERSFGSQLFDKKSMAVKASPLLQSTENSTFNSVNFDMKNRFSCKRIRGFPVGSLSGSELRVFIVAGEASGDAIGGRLMSSLKQLSPVRPRFAGIGGVLMSEEGLESLFPMDDLTVMGFWELTPHVCRIMGRLEEATEAALEFHPHIVVTVDSKGFAFHLLKRLRGICAQQGLDPPFCVQYVAPSFWAWKGGEKWLRRLNSIVDHVLCILPFEEEVCRVNGLAATFVGHPILEDAFDDHNAEDRGKIKWRIRGDGANFRIKHRLSSDATLITLLPGSRLQEVKCMLPIFGRTLELIKDSFHDLTAVIPVAPNQQIAEVVKKLVKRWDCPVVLVAGESIKAKYDAFDASVAGLTTSGTAVLQLQLARLPCVVAYRTSLLKKWSVLLQAKSQYMALPNILLNSEVLPESKFLACTPKQLASLIRQLIQNEHLQEQQAVAAEKVFDLLSPLQNPLDEASIKGLQASHLLQNTSQRTPSMVAAFTILTLLRQQG